MNIVELILLALVLLCGIGACLNKNLMVTLIIFMAFSVFMSVIWAILEAPDLAVTEAAVGAGISGILLFVTLRRLKQIKQTPPEGDETALPDPLPPRSDREAETATRAVPSPVDGNGGDLPAGTPLSRGEAGNPGAKAPTKEASDYGA